MGGLLQAIFGQVDPNQLPRRPMNSGQSPLSGDFGAPGSWSDPNNYQSGGRLLDRIADDSTRHPQGFEDQAPTEGQGLRQSLAQQVAASQQPQQPSRLDQMQGQYDQLGQQINQPPKKMGMLKSLMLGALAGPKAGQAFQARNQNQQFQQNQLRERQNSLLQQIEAERRMQEEQDRLNQAEDFQERMAGQSRQFSAEHEPVQTIETDKGPMQFDRNTRQWSPIMANGQPVGPKAQPKPDQLDQQYNEAIQSGDQPRANRILQEIQALSQAKRDPNAGAGTWQLDENDQGEPIQFNSKTGATRPAPGIHKPGTFAKGQGAADDAMNYASLYEKQGATGPGDEALMEKYFELAKPTTGFRMTQNQMDMLQNSRSWMQSAEGIAYHAKTGVWFTPQQRSQIIGTMRTLRQAKGMNQAGGGKGGSQVLVEGKDF